MKILFVCTSNVCRSVIAESLLKSKIENLNNQNIEVYSAGILAQNGDIPMHNVVEALLEIGINVKEYKSKNIQNINLSEMNLILCATNSNKSMLIRMYPELKNKIYTIKEYSELGEEDVIEPWGYDIAIYRKCVSEIENCIEKIIPKIIQEIKSEE